MAGKDSIWLLFSELRTVLQDWPCLPPVISQGSQVNPPMSHASQVAGLYWGRGRTLTGPGGWRGKAERSCLVHVAPGGALHHVPGLQGEPMTQ